jgi:NADH:ubiquinone oxidoreductase subunit 6 (subunit J)
MLVRVYVGALLVLTAMGIKLSDSRNGSMIQHDAVVDVTLRVAITVGYVLIFWTIYQAIDQALTQKRSDHDTHHGR